MYCTLVLLYSTVQRHREGPDANGATQYLTAYITVHSSTSTVHVPYIELRYCNSYMYGYHNYMHGNDHDRSFTS